MQISTQVSFLFWGLRTQKWNWKIKSNSVLHPLGSLYSASCSGYTIYIPGNADVNWQDDEFSAF